MKSRRSSIGVAAIFGVLLTLLIGSTSPAWADGSETLGAPSIPIADGTGVVAAGTGLLTQPGTINLNVPVDATVEQVLLYWEGFARSAGGSDNTIIVDGIEVTGALIGGPDFFFSGAESSTYRADVTSLGLIGPGANSVSVEGLDFTRASNGAGILAIIDDGTGATTIDLRDGNDTAFINFSAPRMTTVPQQYSFAPTGVDRVATLAMFFSSVQGSASKQGPLRPSTILVTIDGLTQEFNNLLGSFDGEEWDTLVVAVDVPAGASSLIVQARSEDRTGSSALPASLVWNASALFVPPAPVGMVGDTVFEDEDADGLQCRDLNGNKLCDSNEPFDPGIPDVKVNLTSLCDDPQDDVEPGDPASMQRTDQTGFYKFTGLPIGCKYTVTIDPCNFDSSATCGDGGPGGALEGKVESPPQIGPDACLDSGGVDGAGQPVGDMAMTRLPLTPPFSDDQSELNDPCLDFGYFPPPVEIEKFTNGHDADAADGFPTSDPGNFEVGANEIPLVGIGESVVWSYDVTNPGPATLVNIVVTDDKVGGVSCPKETLAAGETMRCTAMGVGLDLSLGGGVNGCSAQGAGEPVPTYENLGKVDARVEGSNVDVTASDPSHYCNPPEVMVEKFTNGHDGDDASGSPAAGSGNFQVGASTVAEIPADGAITWTYRVTNTGDEDLVAVSVTDSKGVFVDCPQATLAMGETITCTATGFADDLFDIGGDVAGCDAQGQGEPRPTYENLATVTASGETSGVEVTDDDPSHYCNPAPPPECGLTVQKGCTLPPPPAPPAPPEGKCDGKLQQYTMIWDGSGPITVTPGDGVIGISQSAVAPGDEVTFTTDGSTNDTIVNISGAASGASTFHISCSDGDMDGDTTTNDDQQQVSSFGRDCGKFQGDGKGSSGINDWLLEGFVDNSGAVLDCTTDTGGPLASVCEFNAIPADCDSLPDKPENLTWLYSGGGCAALDNDQDSGDLFCEEFDGGVNPDQAVTITDDGDNVFNVQPGGVFTASRSDSKVFTLTNAGGTEQNGRHVSCSQPLQAGDVYGSLTLVALEGLGIGTNVTYSYLVSNAGPDLVTNISVSDDQLGSIGGISSLAPGDSMTLTADAFVSETTTNVAAVDGAGPPGSVCSDQSAPVTVKILPPPPCDVGIVFDKLEDDKIKWKLSNNSAFGKATLQTFALDFPSGFDAIEKVKLDGDIYKASDSSLVVGPGVTIGEDDWTQDDVTKRELEQGETRTLEIEFEEKDKTASPGDFDLLLTFEEGCVATF